jgi:hypothetical protein
MSFPKERISGGASADSAYAGARGGRRRGPAGRHPAIDRADDELNEWKPRKDPYGRRTAL